MSLSTTPANGRPALPFGFALALFVLSGATSLVDQVAWLKYLSYTFGNTTEATSILLSVFMGGLAAGAWWWGRRAARLRQDPLLVYGLLEGGIGLLAALSPLFFLAIDVAYVALFRSVGHQPTLFVLLRGLLAAAFLFPATFLMGGTLPLLARGFEEEGRRRGRAAGLLYAANTAGAFAGTLAATWFLVPVFGLRLTLGISAATNFAILAAIAISRRRAAGPERTDAEMPVAAPPPPAPGWLALFFVVGFASLAYEVVWTRILVFYLGSSVYAFGTMLGVILAGLALGSALAAPILPRLARPALALAVLEAVVAVSVVVQVVMLGHQVELTYRIATWFGSVTPAVYAFTTFLATALLLGPATLAMGAAFPVAVRLAAPTGEAGEGVGRVYAANTLGAILGSLAGGYLLIPAFGTQSSLFVLAGLNLACAGAASVAAVAPGSRRRLAALPAVLAIAALPFAARLFPPDRVIAASGMLAGENAKLLDFREDTTCSVAVRELPFAAGPALSIEVNGVNVAGSAPDLVAIQKLQGHLPLLVHGSASSVLHIGFGSGGTCWAVSRHPVEEITIAEISPAVLEVSDANFRSINRGVLSDPRVHVAIADGRNWVMGSDRTWDVILSDSIHPRYAGNGSLYSEDYFRLCRKRLPPGGVISMWLPIYSLTPNNLREILRAFVDVYPAASVWYPSKTLNPFLIVLARTDDRPLEAETFVRTWGTGAVSAELAEIGYTGPADLLADLVSAGPTLADWLRNTAPHLDDRPTVEYESGRLLDRNGSWLACFEDLLAHRSPPTAGIAATSDEGKAVALEAARLAAERTTILRAHADILRKSIQLGDRLQGIATALPQ